MSNGKMISIAAADGGKFNGYLASPKSGATGTTGPGGTTGSTGTTGAG